MALGGGTFLVQNKVLPGAYINFVSAARASASLSDRGYAALPVSLDWGVDGEVFTVEVDDFIKNSLRIFGYAYDAEELKPIRDLFKHAQTVYFYRLNGAGAKAKGTLGSAKYAGPVGNRITVIVTANIDDSGKFDVVTKLGSNTVDEQKAVADMASLLDNDFVVFDRNADLAATAGDVFSGGTNEEVTGQEYQDALAALEKYSFNTLGCLSTTDTIKGLFVSFTKRMRDSVGVKFQTIVYNYAGDYEGIINLNTGVKDAGAEGPELVYWLLGAESACAVNASLTNAKYDGEYIVDVSLTQTQLENAIEDGQLVFHKVGDDVRVLSDIDSLTTTTDDKGEDFKENQVIRVLDQIGNDIATLFNEKYIGKVQNDAAGRVSLWGDIVDLLGQLNDIRALEDFDGEDVTVEKGNEKKAVTALVYVTPVCAMAKLYMTVKVQ